MERLGLYCVFILVLQTAGLYGLCPEKCDCFQLPVLTVNCSNSGLREIPDLLGIEIRILDLSYNYITDLTPISAGLFQNATEIILDHNSIEVIPDSIFRGIRIHKLSIRNNRIRKLGTNSFKEFRGFNSSSILDLRVNPLELISGSAFAYAREIAVVISGTNLRIDPYAFYGVYDIPRIAIHDVESLDIQPGAFTNAENVRQMEMRKVHLNSIAAFTFQGITNIESFVFKNCVLRDIEAYAFASVHYASGAMNTQNEINQSDVIGGGAVSFEACEFDVLPSDTFRDTNVASISISRSAIGRIAAHFSRGLTSLLSVRLIGNSIRQLSAHALGSMVGLKELILQDNDIDRLPGYTFKGVQDIKVMKIQLSQDTSFMTNSFSGVHDVAHLAISGRGERVAFQEGTFSGLVGVQRMELVHLDIPELKEKSLQGMSRILKLRLASCRINVIRPGVFKGSSVDVLDMSDGNDISCDCAVLREIESVFMSASVECTDASGIKRMLNFGARQPPLGVTCPEASSLYTNAAVTSLQASWLFVALYACLSL
ncbi:hypothetical protein CAPTEDRAFT_202917 [Capitella teleta]|uniref:LRRCT domain-containing protein n=1 Tax=Capitella teleta TaxID=283909 RepID=R7U9D2_CAPTE|nr:hypothetical protein CAPTEDRAFT_202917 [Capitella teleta]|eukprot:ELU02594.1 hypothetical protein CAPTEDRAFT_202917 [Capitella teleta]